MNRVVVIGSAGVAILLWSIHNASDQSPLFPEPIEGYSNKWVGYDDLPPDNPLTIDVGTITLESLAGTLAGLKDMDRHDGLEIVGTLENIANREVKVACIAIDFTRQSDQEHQLITSQSDFFELKSGMTTFRLLTRTPNYKGPMQITLTALLLDESGVPVSNGSILMTGTLTRPNTLAFH